MGTFVFNAYKYATRTINKIEKKKAEMMINKIYGHDTNISKWIQKLLLLTIIILIDDTFDQQLQSITE